MTQLERPEPGYYKIRLKKGERYLPCRIVDATERDEAGRPVEDERFDATLQDRAVHYSIIWPSCSKNPITVDEYIDLMSDDRLRPGGNNPPEETVLEAAAEIAAAAGFLTSAREIIDTVKRTLSLAKRIDEERKAAVADLEAQIKTIEAPYREATADLDSTKKMLLKELAPFVPKGEKVKGDFATASWRSKIEQAAEITDAAAVPREWCRPDAALILEGLRKGATIPGARLTETETHTLVVS